MKLNKKRKGSALVTVLILTTALMIIGSQLAVSIVQTRKTNEYYNSIDDLELMAKSGANIGKNYLINEINKLKDKGITSFSEIIYNKDLTNYVSGIMGNSQDALLEVEIEDGGVTGNEKKYIIKSIATLNGISKQIDSTVKVTLTNKNN